MWCELNRFIQFLFPLLDERRWGGGGRGEPIKKRRRRRRLKGRMSGVGQQVALTSAANHDDSGHPSLRHANALSPSPTASAQSINNNRATTPNHPLTPSAHPRLLQSMQTATTDQFLSSQTGNAMASSWFQSATAATTLILTSIKLNG